MKDKMMSILRSLALLFALTILFSLIFASLYYFHVISQNMFHILNWMFGFLAFLAAGVWLGIGIKKKALLHAFVIALILAVFGFLMMPTYEIMSIVEFISKLLAYLLGVILVLNFKK